MKIIDLFLFKIWSDILLHKKNYFSIEYFLIYLFISFLPTKLYDLHSLYHLRPLQPLQNHVF